MTLSADIATAPDFAAIKMKQTSAWASGDYTRIGVTLQIVGETLAEAMDLPPDSRVLDVAAGNGNATLAFARRWCRVTSTDYVDALLARGRERAEAETLEIAFEIADAESLPYDDAAFDAVVSTFGVMFTPDQTHAASELMRVCRSGGKIGLANWTAEGFIGQLFRALGKHVPPPAGLASPTRWGNEAWLVEALGPEAGEIRFDLQQFLFRYRSPDHFIQFFRTFYGPMHKAFKALEPAAQSALHSDLRATIARFNTARDGSMRVPSDYAQVIITKA